MRAHILPNETNPEARALFLLLEMSDDTLAYMLQLIISAYPGRDMRTTF